MKTIIIGTNGDQSFKIAGDMVSRKHAKVTIDDNGQWTIEDLDSANGTFIRNAMGKLVRVGKVTITPDTYICLGPDNALGCKFYACHLTAEEDNYSKEFDLLQKYSKELAEKSTKVEKTSEIVTKVIGVVSLLLLVGSLFIKNQGINVHLLRIGTALSTFSTLIYSPRKQLKQLATHYNSLFSCPNPNCNSKLTQKEINDCQCSKCKAHA